MTSNAGFERGEEADDDGGALRSVVVAPSPPSSSSATSCSSESGGDPEPSSEEVGVGRGLPTPAESKPTVGDAERGETTTTTRRRPLNQEEFFTSYEYREKPRRGVVEKAKSAAHSAAQTGAAAYCSARGLKAFVLGFMPILSWLPSYSVRNYLVGDIISGVTVAVFHIPQGMAYALLAGMPAVNGLYMAFFPVLVYVVFCTSRHTSMGSFAITLLMAGTLADQVLEKYGRVDEKIFPSPADSHHWAIEELPSSRASSLLTALNRSGGAGGAFGARANETSGGYTATQAVTVVALAAGLWQILMGVLRMGAFSVLLSDVLVSGFTTGSAVHVLTSQLKNIFGLKVPKETRFPKLLRTHWFVIRNIFDSNATALIVSAVAMAILAINNDHLKPRLAKKCKVPVPIELIAVIVGTATSYFLNLHEDHDLTIIGSLPTGLPAPEIPKFEILHDLIAGSAVVAIVAYTTSYSMARILALRQNYEVDANQELIAQGLGNITGAFFRSGPIAASLSRSLIQQTVGGSTQMASVVSCSVLLVILLFIGPLFESLPNCILSSIILVALKGMFVQFKDLKSAWDTSKLDAMIWLATFLSVVVVDIDVGLGVGVAVSLIALIWRGQRAYACILGEIPGSEGVYVDVKRYAAAEEIHNVKIFHFGAGIHFANAEYFKESLFSLTNLDPVKWREGAKKRVSKSRNKKTEDLFGNTSDLKSGGHRGLRDFLCCFARSEQVDKTEKDPYAPGGGSSGIPVTTLNGNLAPPPAYPIDNLDEHAKGGEARKLSVHMDETGYPLPFRYLLIDLSGVGFIDAAGTKLLKILVQDYDKINVIVVFSGAPEPVLRMFKRLNFNLEVPPQYQFPTVGDAVESSRWKCVPKRGTAGAAQLPPQINVDENVDVKKTVGGSK